MISRSLLYIACWEARLLLVYIHGESQAQCDWGSQEALEKDSKHGVLCSNELTEEPGKTKQDKRYLKQQSNQANGNDIGSTGRWNAVDYPGLK
jgi:hypothetical protein